MAAESERRKTLSRLCVEWKGWFILCIMQERVVKCRVAYRFLCCQRGRCSHPLPPSLHSGPCARSPLLLLLLFLVFFFFVLPTVAQIRNWFQLLCFPLERRLALSRGAQKDANDADRPCPRLSSVPVCWCHVTSDYRCHLVMLENLAKARSRLQ